MTLLVLLAALVAQEATVDGLIATLRHPDPEVRRKGAAALRERPAAGGVQAEALARALRLEPEAAVRYELVRALGGSGAPGERLRPELLWAVGDPDGAVRWAAIEVIGSRRIAGPDVAAALEARLADPHVPARQAAAAAVARADPDPERSALRLIRLWSHPDEGTREGALQVLEGLGAEAMPAALSRVLELTDGPVAVEAAGRLARCPGAGTAALTLALRSGDPPKRAAAAGALAEHGAVPGAVEALVAAMDDPVPAVRGRAVRSLGAACRGAPDELVAPVLRRLDDPDPLVRIAAARVLLDGLDGKPGERARRVCDVFEQARREGWIGRLHDEELALLHESLGRWSEALRCWEEFRNGDDGTVFCDHGRGERRLSGIARCALRAGQRDRALAAFRKLPGFDGDERSAGLRFDFLGRIGRFEGRRSRVDALGGAEREDAALLFGLARVARLRILGGSGSVAEEREELTELGRLLGQLGGPAVVCLSAALMAGEPMAVELAGDTGLPELIPALESARQAAVFRRHVWMIDAALHRLRESR